MRTHRFRVNGKTVDIEAWSIQGALTKLATELSEEQWKLLQECAGVKIALFGVYGQNVPPAD